MASMSAVDEPLPPPNAERRRWMGILARASATELERHLADIPTPPPHRRLRGPETGLVMVRGRAGGDGAAFNLGEMTVTRCAVTSVTVPTSRQRWSLSHEWCGRVTDL